MTDEKASNSYDRDVAWHLHQDFQNTQIQHISFSSSGVASIQTDRGTFSVYFRPEAAEAQRVLDELRGVSSRAVDCRERVERLEAVNQILRDALASIRDLPYRYRQPSDAANAATEIAQKTLEGVKAQS